MHVTSPQLLAKPPQLSRQLPVSRVSKTPRTLMHTKTAQLLPLCITAVQSTKTLRTRGSRRPHTLALSGTGLPCSPVLKSKLVSYPRPVVTQVCQEVQTDYSTEESFDP